jgi:hypothetical protein
MQDSEFSGAGANGSFTFQSLAGFLQNQPATVTLDDPTSTRPIYVHQTLFGAYLQDGWHWRSNLMLNFGVRYEHTLTVKARWPVAPAGEPAAMEMDRERRRLFSSGRDPQFLVMMNADSGKIIQSLPISAGVDGSVYEAGTALLFVSTRDGKVHIFHEDSPDKLTEVETLKTEFGAGTIGIDPKTHNLFLTTADFGPAPAAPTKENPEAERKPIPGTFRVLIYGR